MRLLLVLFAVVLSVSLKAQNVITITENTIVDSTIVITENTIIEGIGMPELSLQGSPKIIAKDCRVLVKNVVIKDMHDWGTISGEFGCLEWYGIGMRGSMIKNMNAGETFLDGTPK